LEVDSYEKERGRRLLWLRHLQRDYWSWRESSLELPPGPPPSPPRPTVRTWIPAAPVCPAGGVSLLSVRGAANVCTVRAMSARSSIWRSARWKRTAG